MTLWVDVEDLFVHARIASRPSGIQRLSFGIYSALAATPGVAVGFVRHDGAGRGYRTVIWDEVRGVYERMAHTPRPVARPAPDAHGHYAERRWTARIPVELRDPLGQAARAQAAAIGAAWRA
ncbi:hypothetical protein GXW71_29955, partial [Roseomonas hellenica]|nr:hypothetical protein [Plastoroseomonas hellenica]